MLHAFSALGVPATVLTDNMKSVVVRRDADGRPVWQADYAEFMGVVGFRTRLCRPRHPYTKGKVERLVRFVKGNFLAGRHRLNRGGGRQANSALHEIARQRVMRDPETAEYAERARGRGKSDREVMRCLKRYVAREAYRALMRPHEIRRPEDASELVAARRAAKVSQVRAASILGTSEKYISMLERGQRELKPIRRAYEAWVEAGLPLDWDRQAFEAERKMDSKKHLAK